MAAEVRSPDGRLLDELSRSGSELEQLHRIDFFLHFPTLEAAQQAEFMLIQLAFATEIEQDGETWKIQASKNMYPVESDLQGLRDKLEVIAADGKGSYEGWRARVITRQK
jgi:hypothetical protein